VDSVGCFFAFYAAARLAFFEWTRDDYFFLFLLYLFFFFTDADVFVLTSDNTRIDPSTRQWISNFLVRKLLNCVS
jgi:hypothetical protein